MKTHFLNIPIKHEYIQQALNMGLRQLRLRNPTLLQEAEDVLRTGVGW